VCGVGYYENVARLTALDCSVDHEIVARMTQDRDRGTGQAHIVLDRSQRLTGKAPASLGLVNGGASTATEPSYDVGRSSLDAANNHVLVGTYRHVNKPLVRLSTTLATSAIL
jgi:hypothetical protein